MRSEKTKTKNRERSKIYRLAKKNDPEYRKKRSGYAREYYARHTEELKEYTRTYYAANKKMINDKTNAWKWRMKEEAKKGSSRVAMLSTKFRFGQSFLFPILKLDCKEEVAKLMNQLIQCPTLTGKQREVLVMLRDGYSGEEIARLTHRNQSTINKTLNGAEFHVEDEYGDEIMVFYGGAGKKCIQTILNFQAVDPFLQALIAELSDKRCDLQMGKKVCEIDA